MAASGSSHCSWPRRPPGLAGEGEACACRHAWPGRTGPGTGRARVWYALRRLPGLLRPPVSVYEPAAGSLSVLRDLPVVVRDGTTLRVNIVLPAGAGRFPVLMSAHQYGKDNLPQRRSRGYRVSFQYRMLRQPAPVRFSVLTGWEAPDPAWWAARGLRGGEPGQAYRRPQPSDLPRHRVLTGYAARARRRPGH